MVQETFVELFQNGEIALIVQGTVHLCISAVSGAEMVGGALKQVNNIKYEPYGYEHWD